MYVCVRVCVFEELINHKELNLLINVLQCVSIRIKMNDTVN